MRPVDWLLIKNIENFYFLLDGFPYIIAPVFSTPAFSTPAFSAPPDTPTIQRSHRPLAGGERVAASSQEPHPALGLSGLGPLGP